MPLAGIISKPGKVELETVLPELLHWLRSRDWRYVLDVESAAYLGGSEGAGNERPAMVEHAPEVVVVLGGDGTLLSAARAFARTGTPLLSVNLGSLGFLTEVPLSDLYATIEAWCAGCGVIDERSLMRSELHCEGRPPQAFDALNDVVLAKGTIARMADFTVAIDGQLVATFRADGVIVSTPTGSTAYNLAANGPIVMPAVNCMVVTPICPHLLTIRPIVVPGDAAISIEVVGVPNEIYLTIDGQEAFPMAVGDKMVCHRSEYSVKLLRLKPNGLFNVLRSKLKWGER
jgi:NAD+ kinase